jgi:hypothetical protein
LYIVCVCVCVCVHVRIYVRVSMSLLFILSASISPQSSYNIWGYWNMGLRKELEDTGNT